MPSPKFTFRLPEPDKKALLEVAKRYGAPSPGAFVAEMVGTICSGDADRLIAFSSKLTAKLGGQMVMAAVVHPGLDRALMAPQKPSKPRKPKKRPRRRPERPPRP